MAADPAIPIFLNPKTEPTQPAQHPRDQQRANTAIMISVVAAVVAVGAVIVGILQYKAAVRQANIAQGALDLSKTSAQEQKADVERSRKAAEDVAESTKASIGVWQRAAAAADRTSRTSQEMLQNTINSFRAERRPLLMLSDGRPLEDGKIGRKIEYTNDGITPAYRMAMNLFYEWGKITWMYKDGKLPFTAKGHRYLMGSAQMSPLVSKKTMSFTIVVPPEVLALMGEYDVRISGVLTYRDMNDVRYHSDVCYDLRSVTGESDPALMQCIDVNANASK